MNEREPAQDEPIVKSWIAAFSETGQLGEMDRDLLRAVLEAHGAKFSEITPEVQASLQKYSNKGRAEAMRHIWGERFDEYKIWTNEWVADYEERTGQTLPALTKSGRKNSGMIQFLGEITAYAAGELSYEHLKLRLETRLYNGLAWAEGRREERKLISKPGTEKLFRPSSIPPGFPTDAWEKIKGW